MAEPASPTLNPASAPRQRARAGLPGLIAAAWQVPGDSPEDVARLRNDQWRAIVEQLPISAVATAIAVSMLMAALPAGTDLVPLWPVLAALVALNGFNFALWWHECHRRSPSAPERGVRAGLCSAVLPITGLAPYIMRHATREGS